MTYSASLWRSLRRAWTKPCTMVVTLLIHLFLLNTDVHAQSGHALICDLLDVVRSVRTTTPSAYIHPRLGWLRCYQSVGSPGALVHLCGATDVGVLGCNT